MGSVTPSGVIYEPLKRYRTLLASLSSVQTWLSAKDATAALASIFYEWTDSNSKHILLYTSGWSVETIARGSGVASLTNGFFGAKFFAPVPTGYVSAPDDALVDFLGTVAGLVADAHAASGKGGDLTIYSTQLMDRMLSHWADEPGSAGFLMADFRVVYGA